MSPEHARAIDEVHRCVGRNVLLYQTIEQVLKMLLPLMRHDDALHCLDGFEDRHSKYSPKTLGPLFQAFHDRNQSDQAQYLNAYVTDLLAQRNRLVHHAGFDLSTVDSCRAVASRLNEEHAKAIPIRDLIRDILLEVLRALCDFTFRGTPEEAQFRKLLSQAEVAIT